MLQEQIDNQIKRHGSDLESVSIQQLIEGHAESIRMSVEGFPDWVKELKVKEQLGFFEPILEGPEDCPKTS